MDCLYELEGLGSMWAGDEGGTWAWLALEALGLPGVAKNARADRGGLDSRAGQVSGFSPIFLLHLQHLLPEKVLPHSLHVIEVVSQELE